MEKEIMSKLYHPFIINMYACFQDKDNLYMVLDYSPYKDLRDQYKHLGKVPESDIKFFAGCILLALNCIHSNKVIHKDLKPENLLFDDKAYIRVTDFGISKFINSPFKGICGTQGYYAPENLSSNTRLGYENDYFSLGVILYELAIGRMPSSEHSRKFLEIQSEDSSPSKEDFIQQGYSSYFSDFVFQLLEEDPSKRLGHKGFEEIQSHKWFFEFDWRHLHYKTIRSPFLSNLELNSAEKRGSLKAKSGLKTSESGGGNSTQSNSTYNSDKDLFADYYFVHYIKPGEIVYYGKVDKPMIPLPFKKTTKIVINAENCQRMKDDSDKRNNEHIIAQAKPKVNFNCTQVKFYFKTKSTKSLNVKERSIQTPNKEDSRNISQIKCRSIPKDLKVAQVSNFKNEKLVLNKTKGKRFYLGLKEEFSKTATNFKIRNANSKGSRRNLIKNNEVKGMSMSCKKSTISSNNSYRRRSKEQQEEENTNIMNIYKEKADFIINKVNISPLRLKKD